MNPYTSSHSANKNDLLKSPCFAFLTEYDEYYFIKDNQKIYLKTYQINLADRWLTQHMEELRLSGRIIL